MGERQDLTKSGEDLVGFKEISAKSSGELTWFDEYLLDLVVLVVKIRWIKLEKSPKLENIAKFSLLFGWMDLLGFGGADH